MSVLLPYVVAPVAVALIFSNMFGDQYGLVNNILGRIGPRPRPVAQGLVLEPHRDRDDGQLPLDRLQRAHLARRDAGDPPRLLRGRVDRRRRRIRQFFSITVPSLRPTLIFVIITSTIGGLQIFDEPRMYDTTGAGGADAQWLTITLYLYNRLRRLAAGTSATRGRRWILFIIIVDLGLINLAVTRRSIASSGSRAGI